MKRIGILTAGGDTPALNATIHGAVVRANELKVEVYGLIKGFNSLCNPRVPHVHLNRLFQVIPELDPTTGGTVLGASRAYLSSENHEAAKEFGSFNLQTRLPTYEEPGPFHRFRTNNFPGSCRIIRFISRPSRATDTAEDGNPLRRMTSSMALSSFERVS